MVPASAVRWPSDIACWKSSSSFSRQLRSGATTRSRTRSTVSKRTVSKRDPARWNGSWKLTYHPTNSPAAPNSTFDAVPGPGLDQPDQASACLDQVHGHPARQVMDLGSCRGARAPERRVGSQVQHGALSRIGDYPHRYRRHYRTMATLPAEHRLARTEHRRRGRSVRHRLRFVTVAAGQRRTSRSSQLVLVSGSPPRP